MLAGTLPPPLRAPLRPPAPPIDAWMRAELRPLVEGYLLGDDPEELFVRAGVEELWRGFLARRVGWREAWTVAVLRAWIAARRGRRRDTGPRGVRDQDAA